MIGWFVGERLPDIRLALINVALGVKRPVRHLIEPGVGSIAVIQLADAFAGVFVAAERSHEDEASRAGFSLNPIISEVALSLSATYTV
jgi:hypothetical protein